MKRTWTIVCVAVVIAVACLSASPAWAASAPSRRVTLVIATGLTWADLTPTSTPTLWRLAGQGALGTLNSRVRTRDPGEQPSPFEGALDFSAGNWATPDYTAGAAFDATESVAASTTAAEQYARVTGAPVGSSAICFTGLPAIVQANSDPSAEIVVGTLGQAVHDAGGVTGAVGNSDAGSASTGDLKLERPAAVAAMDARGLVDFGDVSEDLLEPAPEAPYGVRTDVSALERAIAAFDARADAHGGPSLLVVDPGDAYRTRRYADAVSPDVALAQHQVALAELDRVVRFALDARGSSGTVVVAAQALYNDTVNGMQGFGPVLAVGPGLDGYLTSASTHRAGIVTNPDVTAEVLGALGLSRPVQVMGSAFGSVAAPSDAQARIGRMSALNSTIVAVDGARVWVVVTYLRFFVVVMVLAGILIVLRERFPQRAVAIAAKALFACVLLLLSVPVAGWAMFLATRSIATSGGAIALLLVTSAVVWALGLLAWRFAGARAALGTPLLLTVLVLLGDQLFGAPLSLVNFMGYSPLQSARYYGIGNEAAGLVVGAGIVGVALALDRWPGASWTAGLRRWGIAVLGAIVVVATAAPFLGANVGVVIWGLAGFVVAWAFMNGRGLGWKTLVVAVLIVAVLLAAFTAIDLFGRGEQTHLARSVTSAEQGGLGQLWIIVTRKAQTNARVLGDTRWVAVLYAIAGFLAAIWLFRASDLADMLAENPAFRSALIATVVAGVLAFFTEDSGIIVPAFILLSAGASAAGLLLSRLDSEPGSR